MADYPPSTAPTWFSQTGLPGVEGHADSHQDGAGDPIIQNIRSIGNVSKTTNQTTTSSTFADVTDLSLTARVRGGLLMIILTGPRAGVDSTAASVRREAEGACRAVVGSTNLDSLIDGVAITYDAASLDQPEFRTSSAMVWYTTPAAGTYTIKIQFRRIGGSSYQLLGATAPLYLQVFEINAESRP